MSCWLPRYNILRHPAGRSQETYGEDVHHLSRMAIASVRGVQQYVLANPKHYTANSIEEQTVEVDVSIDERSLREIYLPQFRAAVAHEGGAASIMTAYNSVNGQFCSENWNSCSANPEDRVGLRWFRAIRTGSSVRSPPWERL